jgi:hypothetical protein
MKSARHGDDASDVEVTDVSQHGFRLSVRGEELFLAFADFPRFREARLGQLLDVTLLHKDHLCWPQLDVDLPLERVRHPERSSKAGRQRQR